MFETIIRRVNSYHDSCLGNKGASVSKRAEEDVLDLRKVDDFSLSALMRELRKEGDDKIAAKFLEIYKLCFDLLVCNSDAETDVSQDALNMAFDLFSQLYQIKLTKKAMIVQANNAQMVGQYLANIIKFTLSRISNEKRPGSIERLKHKIYQLNEAELANKKLPASSSMGQAITFVKHVLFNHHPQYIRDVLNSIVQYL